MRASRLGNTLYRFMGRPVSWSDKRKIPLEILLQAGAKIQSDTSPDHNSLRLAVKRGDLEPTKLLLSYGAEPNIWFDDLQPYFHGLLMECLLKSQQEIAQELLQFGAEPNTKSSRRLPNQTPLHLAIDGDFEEVVKLLLKKGADPNGLSGFPPFTPLQLSVKKGSVKYTRLFLKHGADVETKGGYCKSLTAIKLAEKAGNEEIIQLLQQATTERTSGNRSEGETEISMPENLQERGE